MPDISSMFLAQLQSAHNRKMKVIIKYGIDVLAFAFVLTVHMYTDVKDGLVIPCTLFSQRKQTDDDKFGIIPALQRKSPKR